MPERKHNSSRSNELEWLELMPADVSSCYIGSLFDCPRLTLSGRTVKGSSKFWYAFYDYPFPHFTPASKQRAIFRIVRGRSAVLDSDPISRRRLRQHSDRRC